jgi:hypothetical protein
MEVEADDFGKMFANMSADEQVAVLRAMVFHMSKHPMQWDYIAIELEEDHNSNLFRDLQNIVKGMFDLH